MKIIMRQVIFHYSVVSLFPNRVFESLYTSPLYSNKDTMYMKIASILEDVYQSGGSYKVEELRSFEGLYTIYRCYDADGVEIKTIHVFADYVY